MLGGDTQKRAFKQNQGWGRNANTEVADILKHKKYAASRNKVKDFEVVREAYVDAYRYYSDVRLRIIKTPFM